MHFVCAALLGVCCDLPAGRKVCRFLSHSANLGCSKCYCEFSKGFNEQDYSNLERSSSISRSNEKHRCHAKKLKKCKTKTKKQAKEKKFAYRYSVLLHLPPVRRLLIDPMHNLLLGSAKYVVRKIWMVAKFLSDSQIGKIHERMERLAFPVDMG